MSYDYSGGPEMKQFECVADYGCETGENPLWHPLERKLYWCDIPNGRIFRYDPASGFHEMCYEGRPVGGFTIQCDGSLLLFMDRGTIVNWCEGLLAEVVSSVEDEWSSRFNDVIADLRGRVFCGTMSSSEKKGSLYRLDLDGSLQVVLKDIGCSNGMAFSLDQRSFYYTDSFAREIYIFDYNIEDGTLANQRVFASFEESEGLPDGATLDADGRLWSALWDGSCIIRLSPNGRVDRRISLPARKTSSLTFGGEDYKDIYVTTAGGNTRQDDGPQAGALFRIRTHTRGVPEFFSRVRIPANLRCD
ncbi:MAG TPA: SMP-30/gluconolactonase/LRE family protein [Terracidiphilus sp.]|nr:SMP-30/gluconolactonase/LRE family protein [Terracidiphilus sp.]